MNPKQSIYKRHDGLILGVLAVIIVLGVWEVIWDLKLISPLFFSGPSAVAEKLRETLLQGTLLSDMAFSGKNFAIGFLLASAAGIVLGIIVGWYRSVRLISN